MDREALVSHWFELTREQMPALAAERGWPVRFDHCFQRILLDNAVGAKWSDVIASPAYRHATDVVIERAIALGLAASEGREDLHNLNANSLAWRGKRKARASRPGFS